MDIHKYLREGGNPDELEQHLMDLDSTFRFKCRRCGKCCKNQDTIIFTPRDIYNIAHKFGKSMEQVIEETSEVYPGRDSRMPIVHMVPRGPKNACPLLVDGRCSVHDCKPTVCALFPLGRVVWFDRTLPLEQQLDNIQVRYIVNDKKSKRTHRQLPPPPDIPQAQLADIETRHRVYSALLNHLTLASDHKQNLLDRGLTEEAIFKFQYRTTPLVGHETIAKTLVLEGLELYGVPGFYRGENGRWTMHFPLRGIMIPCRDREGRIQSLHIRLDKKMKRGGKFLTFSTPEQLDGAAAENWCHVVGPVRESILLIEGYMKADIVHHFTGQTVIAIPGVTSIRHLKLVLDELIALGVRHVMTCFDMDYLKNWHVDEANRNLTLMLGCLPITFGTYLWVPDYNGLDDYIWEFCLERRQPQS